MKRKILIAIDALNTGGEEKSLVELLRNLDKDRYDVTLLTLHHEGEMFHMVPHWVKVVDVPLTRWGQTLFFEGRSRAIRKAVTTGRIDRALAILIKDFIRRFCAPDIGSWLWLKDALDVERLPNENFDFATAYCSETRLHFIVAELINAKRKAVWFHCEIDKWGRDFSAMLPTWRKYDVWVAAASEKIAEEYARHYSDDAYRLVKMPLMTNAAEALQRSQEGGGFAKNEGVTQLFSVGRLNVQKGFDVAIEVLRRLRSKGYNVAWAVAGEGSERGSLERRIRDAGLEASFTLLGNLKNPFPYYRTCDIYVQPSRYEGYCLTLAEARAFAKPIVCTDFAGAKEQVRDGETACVVPCETGLIENAIVQLLDSSELRGRLSANLAKEHSDTRKQIVRIERMLDGASLEELRCEQ